MPSFDDARDCLSWWCASRIALGKSCSKLYKLIELLCRELIAASAKALGDITEDPTFSTMEVHFQIETLERRLCDWRVPKSSALWICHRRLTAALELPDESAAMKDIQQYCRDLIVDTEKRLRECLRVLEARHSSPAAKAYALKDTAEIDGVDPDIYYAFGEADSQSDEAKVMILLAFLVHISKRDHPEISAAAKDALQEQIQGEEDEILWSGSDDISAIKKFISGLAPLAVRNLPESKRAYEDQRWGTLVDVKK